MLCMLPPNFRRLKWDQVIPFDKDNFMVIVAPKIAFLMKDIRDDGGTRFSLSEFMASDPNTFGTEDYQERVKNFSQFLCSRVERYFTTKKAEYLFFDKEEQAVLKKMAEGNPLFGTVEIYLRSDINSPFKHADFEKFQVKLVNKIFPYFKHIGISYITDPKSYILMRTATKERSQRVYQKRTTKADEALARWPSLAKCKTKEEFQKEKRTLCKKFHPDVNKNASEDEMKALNVDLEVLEGSNWYERLK